MDKTFCEGGAAPPSCDERTERLDASQLHETLMPPEEPATRQAGRVDTGPIAPTLMPPDPDQEPTHHPENLQNTRPATSATSSPRRFPDVAGYHIVAELGRGGMGVVYKALQPGLHRHVALKMILGGKGNRKERALFRSEAEVLAQLQHPNIVQIYEIGEHEGSLFFSLEFVAGGCLADAIAERLPTPHEAAHLVRQLAEGIDAAHARGIVHRDLKPANVLIADCGLRIADCPESAIRNPQSAIPKITDFGLAKLIEPDDGQPHQAGGVMGTPSYMPPEQAEGRNWQIGPPADIYALGAILYDLLAGQPPFRGSTIHETLELVCRAKPRPPIEFNPRLPLDLQIICLKCLEKEPGDRYRSASALAADLERFLNGEPISARHYSRWERTVKWARRRPAAAALTALSVVSLLGVGVGGTVIAQQQAELARTAEAHALEEESLRKEAEAEWLRAEQNFTEARQAVAEVTRLGHVRLSRVPGQEKVRRELLEKALGFQEQFLRINGDRPSQRREVAQAQVRVGELNKYLGNNQAAETAYRQALATFRGLSGDQRQEVATTLNDLADLLLTLEKRDEAAKTFEESLNLKKQLVAEQPSNAVYRKDLANGYTSRAKWWLTANRLKEAADDYLAAVKVLSDMPRGQQVEEFARAYANLAKLEGVGKVGVALDQAIANWQALCDRSSEPEYRHELATAYLGRGTLTHSRAATAKTESELSGLVKAAEADYQHAVKLLELLTSEYPDALDHRRLLADLRHNYGMLLRELDRPAEAEKQWRAAVQLWRRLAAELPQQRVCRQKLAQACNELAIALASTQRLREVEALWQDASALQEQLVAEKPTDADAWQDLVNSRSNLVGVLLSHTPGPKVEKACRELVETQERRLRAFPKVAEYRTDVGLAHHQLATALVKMNRLDEALASLRKAAEYSFRDVNALKSQPEWQPLRERAEFKELLD